MLSAIVILIAFGILITVHEGGHFLVAKLFGVYIEKFSIGFGPSILSFKRKGTEFRISLIPLGGYVKMKGENPDEQTTDEDAFSYHFFYLLWEMEGALWSLRGFALFASLGTIIGILTKMKIIRCLYISFEPK